MEQLDNLVLIIYLVEVGILAISTLHFIGILILFVLGVVWLVVVIGTDSTGKAVESTKGAAKYLPWRIAIFICILGIFTPTKDTAYKLLAVYAGIEVIKSPQIQEIGGKSVDVLNKVLDDFLQEPIKENN